jgi:hypothetical protein
MERESKKMVLALIYHGVWNKNEEEIIIVNKNL